jgi:hypothetical protein
MKQNKFPGRCKCGCEVPAYAGSLAKKAGKWVVTCASCSGAVAPVRDMIGMIWWPNGMGYTECSAEYQDAVQAELDARQDYEANETPEAYEALNHAMAAVMRLQAEGGHMGERVQYDKPDVMAALLGGGRVAVRPGGSMQIVQD